MENGKTSGACAISCANHKHPSLAIIPSAVHTRVRVPRSLPKVVWIPVIVGKLCRISLSSVWTPPKITDMGQAPGVTTTNVRRVTRFMGIPIVLIASALLVVRVYIGGVGCSVHCHVMNMYLPDIISPGDGPVCSKSACINISNIPPDFKDIQVYRPAPLSYRFSSNQSAAPSIAFPTIPTHLLTTSSVFSSMPSTIPGKVAPE